MRPSPAEMRERLKVARQLAAKLYAETNDAKDTDDGSCQ